MSRAAELDRIVDWYLQVAYSRWEGPGVVPFFADRARIGEFAVKLDELHARDERALFRLLIAFAMFQSRRDVDIMRIQRTMPAHSVVALTSPVRLRRLVAKSECPHLIPDSFNACCDVHRGEGGGPADCHARRGQRCHVKAATDAIGRMGDFGKLPTSAMFHLGSDGFAAWVQQAAMAEAAPTKRAAWLVQRLSRIRRVGRKLASLYVSALSARELTGIAPWSPEIEGSELVVVDANVARAVGVWRGPRARATYDATERWIVERAAAIDLRRKHAHLPPRSPRFVQQAIYVFASRSNRVASRDLCAQRQCESCPSSICPFRDMPRSARTKGQRSLERRAVTASTSD